MKAIEQYFHVVLFIIMYKVDLWIKPLVRDHSDESLHPVFFFSVIPFVFQNLSFSGVKGLKALLTKRILLSLTN